MLGATLQALQDKLIHHSAPPQPHENPSCWPDFLREDFPIRRLFETERCVHKALWSLHGPRMVGAWCAPVCVCVCVCVRVCVSGA